METAKRCQDRADECLRLMQSAQTETEARLLKSLSQSWIRIANQIDRYQSLVSSSKARTGKSGMDYTPN
jgi:hypothetical protein